MLRGVGGRKEIGNFCGVRSDFVGVDCELVRQALSSRLDGEDLPAGLEGGRVDGHVSACAGCREWLAQAEALSVEWRLGPAPMVPDLTGQVLDALGAGTRRSGRSARMAVRSGLVLTAAVELVVTAPGLWFGHDREAPLHVAHEMGSFGLAVAVGLIAATIRPRLAAGMAWLMTAAAASLAVTAVLDLARGLTTWSDEAPHLVVVAAAVLLWALSRVEPDGVGGAPETDAADGGFGAAGVRPLRLLYRGRARLRPVLARQERKAS